MRRVTFITTILISLNAFCQKDYNPFLYFQIEQSINNFAFVNPGSIAANNNLQLHLGSQVNGGPFQETRKIYFQGSSPLNYLRNAPNHGHLGINLQGDQEGPILSRNRWNAAYAWSTRLSPKWTVSMGAALGQLGYHVKATPVSQGGSSNILDGHLGMWLFTKTEYLGLSANQIFEGELAPIQQAFPIKRVYHLIAGKTFEINPYFQTQTSLTVLYDLVYDHQYDLTILGVFDELLQVGGTARFGRSLVLLAGLKPVQVGVFSDLGITLSYSYPLGKYAPDIRTFAVNLNFMMDKVTYPGKRR